ncbi:DUF3540 domain-containing protein [Variovorax paradoxus]|nr:DUF3540 domain-containing protein [Variovorax paradoxus]
MNVVALRAAPGEHTPVHFIGRLTGPLPDGQLGVEDEQGLAWSCRRAASCLLAPQPGDTVMLSGPDRFRVYLIAVIEQADASASRIDAPGHMTLGGAEGSVSIESAGDVRLRSGGALDMRGERWDVQAETGHCHVDELRVTARTVDATTGRLRVVGKVFETVADRMVQMARNALRMVDEVDQVRAGHLDCKATQTVRIHGRHTTVTGKELVKVDAAQIHMG